MKIEDVFLERQGKVHIMVQYQKDSDNTLHLYLYVTPEILSRKLHQVFYREYIKALYCNTKRKGFHIEIETGDVFDVEYINWCFGDGIEIDGNLPAIYHRFLTEYGVANLPTTYSRDGFCFTLEGNECSEREDG